MRIMLIDEDCTFLERLQEALLIAGFQTNAFHDTQSALRASAGLKPDVFLVDLRMSGNSGLDFVTEIRRCPELAERPVVAMSEGYVPGHHERLLEGIGFCACLKKPFKPEELTTLLGKLTAKSPKALHSSDGPGSHETTVRRTVPPETNNKRLTAETPPAASKGLI